MIENLIISPETEAGKMVLANKLNTIIDTINEQEVEHKIHKRQLDFIMENTEVIVKGTIQTLKELYK